MVTTILKQCFKVLDTDVPDNTVLPEPDAIALLQQYHLPYPKNGFAHSADEAVTFAESIGYPVVLKIVAEGVSHKSDIGGVKVKFNHIGICY